MDQVIIKRPDPDNFINCVKCEREMNLKNDHPLQLSDETYLCDSCFEAVDFKELRKLDGNWPSDKKRISDAIAIELGNM